MAVAASLSLDSRIATLPSDDRWKIGVPAWVASPTAALLDDQVPKTPFRRISFDTTEGTFMNIDVSPDGRSLVFDLLGDLYWLPVDGGKATSLTRGRDWDQAPRFSLDGKYVYFISDREGFKNIWKLTLSDRALEQVTSSHSNIVGTPNLSQDGRYLLAGVAGDDHNAGEVILNLIDPNTGDMTPIGAAVGPWFNQDTLKPFRSRITIYSGVQSSDGKVFFDQTEFNRSFGQASVRLYSYDTQTQIRSRLGKSNISYDEYKPQLSRDGRLIAYFRQYPNRHTEFRILDRANGDDYALFELHDADDAAYFPADDSRPNYAFTPDDQELIFSHDGRIRRVKLVDGSSEVIPFEIQVERTVRVRVQPSSTHLCEVGKVNVIRWPSASRSGDVIAFAATGYVWVMYPESGIVRRLTAANDFEYMPAVSRNGQSVAFVSFAQSDGIVTSGRLMIADIESGETRELLSAPSTSYLIPRWSEDDKKIAVLREVNTTTGIQAAFGWTPIVAGEFHEVAVAPTSSDRSSFYIYARFVGFDEAGSNLIFSFPRSRTETILAMADINGGRQRTLAIGAPDVGGITPSPQLKRLALTRRDKTVYITSFRFDETPVETSTFSPEAWRVSVGGGYYPDWSRSDQITYSFGQNVYRYSLSHRKLESLLVELNLSTPKPARPIAFKGARLITMSDVDGMERVIQSGTIVLIGNRITAVDAVEKVEIPADAVVINAVGKTIMPGLLDTHYHSIGGRGFSGFALPNTHFDDRSAIGYGVTTAWEPGGAVDDGVPAMVDLQGAGRIAGPRWSHSAMGVVGYPWEYLTTYSAASAAVHQHAEMGVHVLKEYNTPTRQQQNWLSAAAHSAGLGIVAHIQNFDGMMTRIVDGYTGGDHPYLPVPFFKDVRELLRQTGYIWTPNIGITSGSLGGAVDDAFYWQRILEERPAEENKREAVSTSFPHESTRPKTEALSVPYEVHRISRVARQAAEAANYGVNIGISAHSMPSVKLHAELWYLWKGGMQIEDVLRLATIGNAKKLGLQEEIGSLEPGKIADILILEKNPLEDIMNTLSIKYTVMNGIIYDSNTGLKVDLSGIGSAVALPKH